MDSVIREDWRPTLDAVNKFQAASNFVGNCQESYLV